MRMLSIPELLFRIIHSVNQLSIYRAVSNWCEEFGLWPNEREPRQFANKEILKSVNSQEVNSLVCAPRTQPASGNRWRESLQNFELQSKASQLAKVCDFASCWRTVDTGMCHMTTPDVHDGFGDFTPVCRECTLPRADPERMQRFQEEH